MSAAAPHEVQRGQWISSDWWLVLQHGGVGSILLPVLGVQLRAQVTGPGYANSELVCSAAGSGHTSTKRCPNAAAAAAAVICRQQEQWKNSCNKLGQRQ